MINFELSTLVDRPLQDIFIFLSNPLNLPKWQSMIASIQQITPGPAGLGAKYTVHAEMLGRKIEGQMEVVEFQPPDRFGFVNNAGPMTVTVIITLKPVGSGAKISLNVQGNPGGVFKLAEGLLVTQVKSQMETNLARLKTVLEAGA